MIMCNQESKKTKESPSPPIVLVEWVDSNQDRGWGDERSMEVHLLPCQTVGFMIKKTKEGVRLCGLRSLEQIGDWSPFADFSTIPSGCIKKITRLVPSQKVAQSETERRASRRKS